MENQVAVGSTLFGLLFMLFVVAIAILGFVFWVWMLIHAVKNKGLSDAERIMWVLIIIFVSFLGALIYFFVGKPKATG